MQMFQMLCYNRHVFRAICKRATIATMWSSILRSFRPVERTCWYVLMMCLLPSLVAACAPGHSLPSAQAITSSSQVLVVTPTPGLIILQHVASPTAPPTDIPASVKGPAPYGPAPTPSALEIQLTQQLFNLINQDRATRGLPAFTWNATLAGGARLHSWNMYHCGFSHTCPDGISQFTRIANEGFGGLALGENIGLAGPSNPPWAHVDAVQESMINEPPTGLHRIVLTSTKLHRVGVGLYAAPNGWIWFTEDFAA